MKYTLARVCLCGALALALIGCVTDNCNNINNKDKEVSLQDAGAVHIAVLTVSLFDKYRDSLQPQFTLSTNDALNQVLPSTLALEDRIVNLLGFSLNLNAALPSTTGAQATTATAQSGSQSSTGQGSGSAGTATAASLPGGGSVTGATLGQDPLLKFWTAAALYQEVQLLNRYVQDAAIPEGFAAFVVRLQVALLPWDRSEPYDAYADISFFMGDFFSNIPSEEIPDRLTSRNEVRVLPLLVTDDIEAAIEARSVDRIRQLSLGLSALIHGVGLGSNLETANEQLQSLTGRGYNSAFTVARTSHNTLRVRFGALNGGKAQYSMIPQTHNVTLLLMVPIKVYTDAKLGINGRTVRLLSRTALINARTGFELKNYSGDRLRDIADALKNKDYKIDPKKGEECTNPDRLAKRLTELVAANNWAKFRECFSSDDYVEPLWVDLASLREESRYQTAILTLPQYKPALGPEKPKQTPLLIDDGKSSISTKLVGITDLDPNKLQVGLKASICSLDKNGEPPEKSAKEVYIAATSIKPDLRDGEFLVTFPSLRAVNRRPMSDEATVVVSTEEENSMLDRLLNNRSREYLGVYAVLKKPPLFVLSVLAGVINSDEKGQGKLVIDIKKAPDSESFPSSVTVKIAGADFDTKAVTTDPSYILSKDKDPRKDPTTVKITKPGTVTMLLFNLNPESNVTVSGTDESGTSSTPITVRVVSLSSSKQKKE